MKNAIKKYLPLFLFTVFFIAGLSIMLYPVVSNVMKEREFDQVIVNYQKQVKTDIKQDSKKLLKEAENYNKGLTSATITDIFTSSEVESSSDYLEILDIDQNGTMGYISIPKIDVKIPIYHGTSAKVLQKGVGHVEGSSFPVGGETTHSILAAHRGLPSARLFTDLDQMKKGDKFYIYIMDQVLAYQVDQILVIDPSNTEPLQIQNGKDYITLVTCTPYAVNTHRLLVRGARIIEEEEKTEEKIEIASTTDPSKLALYVGLVLGIMILSITIYIVRQIIKRSTHLEDVSDTDTIEEMI